MLLIFSVKNVHISGDNATRFGKLRVRVHLAFFNASRRSTCRIWRNRHKFRLSSSPCYTDHYEEFSTWQSAVEIVRFYPGNIQIFPSWHQIDRVPRTKVIILCPEILDASIAVCRQFWKACFRENWQKIIGFSLI